jgi:hypothetical protein
MDKLTPEEIRVLRRESHGRGSLVKLGYITITAAGRKWIAQDDERVKALRVAGGHEGGRGNKKGGKK